jgi:hypothetical protein
MRITLAGGCRRCRLTRRSSSPVSGQDMLAALAAGERDPRALAQLARRSMRGKIAVLEEAFTGHFTSHHAFLLRTRLRRPACRRGRPAR